MLIRIPQMRSFAVILLVALSYKATQGTPAIYPGQYRGLERHVSSDFILSICRYQNNILLPMPGSCSGFYICVDGNAIASSCGEYYHFNPVLKICDDPKVAGCQPQAPLIQVEDPNTYATARPGPYPTILEGGNGLKPNGLDSVTDPYAGDICSRRRNGVLLPKPDSCTQYYICMMQRPYIRSCPPLLHFNASRLVCQDPAMAQCITRTPDEYNQFVRDSLGVLPLNHACENVADGRLLQHHSDCDKYISCHNSRASLEYCPAGLHYSAKHQRCEVPALAKCNVE